MTIDEISTALQEWRGDNEDRHYMLIAIDVDDEVTMAMQGNGFPIGYALASAMRMKPSIKNIVQCAITLKEMDVFFDDNDHDEE